MKPARTPTPVRSTRARADLHHPTSGLILPTTILGGATTSSQASPRLRKPSPKPVSKPHPAPVPAPAPAQTSGPEKRKLITAPSPAPVPAPTPAQAIQQVSMSLQTNLSLLASGPDARPRGEEVISKGKNVSNSLISSDSIHHSIYLESGRERRQCLLQYLNNVAAEGQVVIYANSIPGVESLLHFLTKHGFRANAVVSFIY